MGKDQLKYVEIWMHPLRGCEVPSGFHKHTVQNYNGFQSIANHPANETGVASSHVCYSCQNWGKIA